MKYFALLLLLIFAYSATLSAQTPTPAPAPASASYNETRYGETAEAWQNFAPEREQISLEVPGTMSLGFAEPDAQPPAVDSPYAVPVPSPSPVNPAKSRSYMTLVNGDYYFIFSDAAASPSLNKTVFSFAESQAPGIKPNEIYTFTDISGYHHKIYITKIDERVYTFQTVSLTKDNASTKRFFDGIKIKGMKTQAKETEALQSIIENASSCGSGGNGIGEDNSKSGTANSPSSDVSTSAQTTPVKILSKPRPGYTDYARFYQVTGSIFLRVTFLPNGRLGSISTVKKLPFGLTEQARAAACGIRFEPAIKEGVPYAVTRQVQYNFILY